MSMRYTSLDRVSGLNALRRSSEREAPARRWRAPSMNDGDEPHSRTKMIRIDSDRLAETLGISFSAMLVRSAA
jgi:hypothetical protein